MCTEVWTLLKNGVKIVGNQSVKCKKLVRCNVVPAGIFGPTIKLGTRIPPSASDDFFPRSGKAELGLAGPLSDWKIITVLSSSPVFSSLNYLISCINWP